MDHTFADHDDALVQCATGLKPGRALDLGCGSGGNAVWLAERGWRVTAVDFSNAAIEKAKLRAAGRSVAVEFIVSDVTAYQPDGLYDLITSFYIQLWPGQRARMLSTVAEALAPGGKLLFVSHDKSSPPSGWSREDLESLTTPDEVIAELPGLSIERAEVVEDTGAHLADMPDIAGEDEHNHDAQNRHCPNHSAGPAGATTIVVAVK